MHNSKSTLKKETYKLLCDFKIQIAHVILFRLPDQVRINNKEYLPNCNILTLERAVNQEIHLCK